ncbi:rab-GTPase-TBC domain-containing protein [Cokeromyces recurvatus]|uniref:rab-GTPase-TBC domain-containing protein n=1 Tax=Cokeromyces recurvatus TaxID=90255 RepID=UPI00221E459E|nr:rab-GTPase-TBC domain-containing protein [Cokeromyces recurvatus]KAI7898359.1 rab-GTPase-TBC domain-containing protein [Cokeromyces recurvatus]
MEDNFDSYSIINDPRLSTHSAIKKSDPEEEGLIKLLFSKSKVYVHPSNNPNDFIPGYLSIIEKKPQSYLVAWTPEALIPSKDKDAFVRVDVNPNDIGNIESSVLVSSDSEQFTSYAVSVPTYAIHSFLIKAPSFSKWYGSIVINFKDGHSSGPFWFHDDESKSTMLQRNTQGGKFTSNDRNLVCWGGDEFLERLSQIIQIRKSNDNENLYLMEDVHVKGKVTSTVLYEEKHKEEAKPTINDSTSPSSSSNAAKKQNFTLFESTQMDPFVATLKEARWNILEKLSRVTKFSRDAAISFLNNSTSQPLVSLLPSGVQELCDNETVKRTIDDYDSARIFLAKWAAGLAAQSENSVPQDRKYRNAGVWGHDGWEEETALGVFEVLNSENDFSIPTHTRTKPVTEAEWSSFFDKNGKLTTDESIVKRKIFCGGLEPSIRKEAWLFLTGVYPWTSTAVERYQIDKEKRESYKTLKAKWEDDAEYRNTNIFKDQKHRIDKDVHRTDRTVDIYVDESLPNPDPLMNIGTNENLEILKSILCTYNIYNTKLGYVQGMSDLLSPLYAVISEEPLAFWSFVGFMERMKSNFYADQSGMHKQLFTLDLLLQFMDPALYKHFQRTDSCNFFFCFRWLLVWYKREFPWLDTLLLWEVLWTDYLTDKFHLFIALSILDQHRDVIIEYLKNFDEILKYINDLSMTINLQETLQRAEILYHQFKQCVEAVDNKKSKLQALLSIDDKHNDDSLTKTQREEIKNDLSKLPIINELLRDILKPSYTIINNEKP